MEQLKNNINNISAETEELVKDYVHLFSVRFSGRLARLFGLLASIFILSTLLLIIIVFCSLALAGYLNSLWDSATYGFWTVAGIYLALILLLIFSIIKSKKPLLSNLMVRLAVDALGIEINQHYNLKGLENESENTKDRIETNKSKIKTDIKMLRFVIIESLFSEFLGLFSSKNKDKESDGDTSGEAGNEAVQEDSK